MTWIDYFRRSLFPCCFSSSSSSSSFLSSRPSVSPTDTDTTTFKNRISTSSATCKNRRSTSSTTSNNRISIFKKNRMNPLRQDQSLHPSPPSPPSDLSVTKNRPPPPKSTVIGTIFGPRGGRARLSFQRNHRLSEPFLLLELSVPTRFLAKEMQSGLLRIALMCSRTEFSSCSLRSVPIWTMYCNGLSAGFALRRRATEQDHLILGMVRSTTVGAGVISAASAGGEEIMYMRASYERIIGSRDSETYHLLDPTRDPSHELSVFLLRTGWGDEP